MKKIDETKYPDRIFCNYQSQAGEHTYGAWSNKPYENEGFDNTEYMRADLVPRWHDFKTDPPQPIKEVLFYVLHKGWHDHYVGYMNNAKQVIIFDPRYPELEDSKVEAWMPIPQFNPEQS